MGFTIRRVDYFNTMVHDQPGEAYKLLSLLADIGVNLLAFTAVPIGPVHTQLAIFPHDTDQFTSAAQRAGLAIEGPHPALLVQGDDKLAALSEVHMKLYEAGVNVYAASGAANEQGSFGYIIYVRPEEYSRAVTELGL